MYVAVEINDSWNPTISLFSKEPLGLITLKSTPDKDSLLKSNWILYTDPESNEDDKFAVPPLNSDADIISLPPDTNSNGSCPPVPFILSTNSKLPILPAKL